jgi:hypothetical protein
MCSLCCWCWQVGVGMCVVLNEFFWCCAASNSVTNAMRVFIDIDFDICDMQQSTNWQFVYQCRYPRPTLYVIFLTKTKLYITITYRTVTNYSIPL